MHFFGWGIVVWVGLMIAVNATFMLISPKVWFKLPSWILLKGSLTEKRYASGWGALEVRFTGAVVLGTIGWVLHHALSK